MRLEIDVFGDTQLARELLRFGDRATDMSPAFEEIADNFLLNEERQFSTQGSYASGRWAPLAPSTVTGKAKAGLDPRTLHATRTLRNSLSRQGAPGNVREIKSDEMFVGTSVEYARYHQMGTKHMPRRRPVELTVNRRRMWMKILQRFLVEGDT